LTRCRSSRGHPSVVQTLEAGEAAFRSHDVKSAEEQSG
jgi:hypothetical protein